MFQSFRSLVVASTLFSTFFLWPVTSYGQSVTEQKRNQITPVVSFTNGGTLYGVSSKFGLTENISIRPFIQFGNLSASDSFSTISADAVFFGSSATYNFNGSNSGVNPYVGVGVGSLSLTNTQNSADTANIGDLYWEAGIDYNASDNIVINANYRGGKGFLSIGAGYRF
jgi:opacity protein-like surface antigen